MRTYSITSPHSSQKIPPEGQEDEPPGAPEPDGKFDGNGKSDGRSGGNGRSDGRSDGKFTPQNKSDGGSIC